MRRTSLPYPPKGLAGRVGEIDRDDFYLVYEAIGRDLRNDILRLLPDEWSWDGKRVLDFGCGAGRVLRQFVEEARVGRFSGVDTHAESIDWLSQHASPPFEVRTNGDAPPLPWRDGSFDLIWAVSVFSHLADEWSAWLIELHRLLADEGRLIASFIGPGLAPFYSGEPWDEERTGMNVVKKHQSWDLGGPFVFHSPWWIREHWGRAFTIEELWPAGFGSPHDRSSGQGVVIMRKRPIVPSRELLEKPNAGDEREIGALRHNIEQLHRESADAAATARAEYERTRSWRLTRPLRHAYGMLSALRHRLD